MKNVIDFPSKKPVKTLGEDELKSHADASLLLSCFERVQHAIETIERGEKIEVGDASHGILTETCAALSVLFRRKTGGDAKKVSEDHWEVSRRYLLAGEEPPDMHIPIASADFDPLHPAAFECRTNLELVLSSLNYATKVQGTLLEVFPSALDMDIARIFSIDATTALHVLRDRLSDGAPPDDALAAVKRTLANGEALQ